MPKSSKSKSSKRPAAVLSPRAMKRVKGEKRGIADVTVEDRRLDLIGYLASAGHADLRKQLYGRIPSQRPPPPQPDA